MPKLRKPAFSRSLFLVCYWQDGRFVFENYATGARINAAPITCEVLDFFDGWRPAEELFAHLKQYTPASLRKAIFDLTKHSLLRRSDRQENRTEQAMRAWARWSPAAGFFHFSTKDVPYSVDLDAIERSLRQRAKTKPMPVAIKHYSRFSKVELPRPKANSEFPRVLLARRTWRRFSPHRVELSALSTLLGLTWGVQRWIHVPGLGSMALKTSPSGGALHPSEVYVVARRVDGLRPGLYHYDSDKHRLELLRRRATSRQVTSYLAGQWWFGSAAAVMLMTAVFPRVQWKYDFPRAYRTVLIEAGHLCQTFCLIATWLRLAPFCTMAFADSRIENDLGIDGITESVLYAAGVGSRTPDEDWASVPPARPKRKSRNAAARAQ
jgi:SagB-type dehydrogenase family enzyme